MAPVRSAGHAGAVDFGLGRVRVVNAEYVVAVGVDPDLRVQTTEKLATGVGELANTVGPDLDQPPADERVLDVVTNVAGVEIYRALDEAGSRATAGFADGSHRTPLV